MAYAYPGGGQQPRVAASAEPRSRSPPTCSRRPVPRSSMMALLGRRCRPAAGRPRRSGGGRAGGRAARRRRVVRQDLARATAKADMAFTISAKRITSMWKALAGIAEDAWRTRPAWKTRSSPSHLTGPPNRLRHRSTDPPSPPGAEQSRRPRSPRRRTLPPGRRRCRSRSWKLEPDIYAYGFILTNLDMSTPARAAAWGAGTGTAPPSRHLPRQRARRRAPAPALGYEQVDAASISASLIAAAIAAWLRRPPA